MKLPIHGFRKTMMKLPIHGFRKTMMKLPIHGFRKHGSQTRMGRPSISWSLDDTTLVKQQYFYLIIETKMNNK